MDCCEIIYINSTGGKILWLKNNSTYNYNLHIYSIIFNWDGGSGSDNPNLKYRIPMYYSIQFDNYISPIANFTSVTPIRLNRAWKQTPNNITHSSEDILCYTWNGVGNSMLPSNMTNTSKFAMSIGREVIFIDGFSIFPKDAELAINCRSAESSGILGIRILLYFDTPGPKLTRTYYD